MDRVTVAEIFRHSKFSTLEVGRSSILLLDKLGTYSARAVNIKVVIIIGFASMQLINRTQPAIVITIVRSLVH